jgi:SepF-like predicted cell division protein (DUF552 family)
MKDLKAELEKLLTNAEDCTLIARLAADKQKRETFTRIAQQLRELAADLQAEIAARSHKGNGHTISGLTEEAGGGRLETNG